MPDTNPDKASGLSHGGWLVIAFSSIGHFFAHYFPVIFATALLTIAPAWGVSEGELIALTTLGLVLYGVGAIPASWLGDRWSQVGLMVVYFIGCGVAALIVSMTVGSVGIMLALGLLGLFGSIYHPVGIAWLVSGARKRGMALGINGVFGSLGLALAPVFTSGLIGLSDWALAFQLPAAVSIGCGVLLLLAWRMGLVRDTASPSPEAATPDWWAMRRIIGIFFLAFVTGGMIYQTTSIVMPTLFGERLSGIVDASGHSAETYVTAVYIVAGVANFIGGWLADRFQAQRVYILCWAFQVPALYGIAALFEAPLAIVTALSVFLSIAMLPAENVMLTQYTPRRYWSRVFGVKFILAFGVSAAAMPVVGLLRDWTGDFTLFYIAMACLVAAVTATLFLLPKPSRQTRDEPTASAPVAATE